MPNLVQILERYREDYQQRYSSSITQAQDNAMAAILSCRSGRYGKMLLECQHCDVQAEMNLSCGHRFCHRCQHHDTAVWLERQSQKLLSCGYFLVTFTLPRQLRALALHNQSRIFPMLFDCAVSTLRDFVSNDKSISAQAGMTAVLHTHSRRLNFHPHIHIVIPAGGLNKKRQCWVSHQKRFLFSQRNLAKVFRARFLSAMRESALPIPGGMPKKWVADCRHAGQGLPALKYLSRYLYRGVISEDNVIADNGTHVTFKYRCSQTGSWKRRSLPGADFLRLLFRHVLPKGLRRVRDFGFLHGNAKITLQRIQLILKVTPPPMVEVSRPTLICKRCNQPMAIRDFFKPHPQTG